MWSPRWLRLVGKMLPQTPLLPTKMSKDQEPSPECRPWIMMRSATDSSKADLHVFSKLFDDGLERGQEAKTFSWRQMGGHDDVLDFFVGHLIHVDMTGQPAPSSAVGVFDAAFLPGGRDVAEPRRPGAHGAQQGVLCEGRVVIERDGFAQGGIDPPEHGEHDRDDFRGGLSGEPRG